VVAISTTVRDEGLDTQTVSVATEVRDADGRAIASDTSPVTVLPGESAVVRQRLYVNAPALWSVETPNLYTAEMAVRSSARMLDRQQTRFGIRTLQLDPTHGLRINGRTVKLRGACIHHDNGILGAAAIARAEERRVQLLKEAGFNAIRSSHNPISRAMLDAADKHGMLVMDEAFDFWTEGKSHFDYSLSFPEWWERDIEAIVNQDFNHPSVVPGVAGGRSGRPSVDRRGPRVEAQHARVGEQRLGLVPNGLGRRQCPTISVSMARQPMPVLRDTYLHAVFGNPRAVPEPLDRPVA
jgi:beta-galactosidase